MAHQSSASSGWLYPWDLHFSTLSGSLPLAYVEEGLAEPPLLFIHGLAGDHRHWTKNIETLSKYRRCLAIDLPGHGHSGKADYPFTLNFFIQVIRAFLEEKGLSQVILVGHSMGAQIATLLALWHPQLIKHLVLIAPAGLEEFNTLEKLWLKNLSSPTALKAGTLDHLLHSFETNFYRSRPEAKKFIDPSLLAGNQEELERYSELMSKCVSAMLDETVYDRLPNLSMHVSIIFGENDFLIPNKLIHPTHTTRSLAENAVNKIPAARLFILPQAGHFVNWEKAEEVNNIIIEAL